MKDSDKNEIKLIIKDEVEKGVLTSNSFTRDQRNFAFKIIGFCVTLLGVVAYFGLDSYILNTVDKKIGEAALEQYRSRLNSAMLKAEESADSINDIKSRSINVVRQLEQSLKKIPNLGLINYMYVNSIHDENSSVKIENIPNNGWILVPYRKQNESMNFSLNVKSTNDIYLIVYSYRVKYSEIGNAKSAILLLQSGNRVRELYGDGGEIPRQNGSYQFSGAFIMKDLKPGTYELGLYDFSEFSPTRVYADPRQLVVYKLL